jgi:hypothetical protein
MFKYKDSGLKGWVSVEYEGGLKRCKDTNI